MRWLLAAALFVALVFFLVQLQKSSPRQMTTAPTPPTPTANEHLVAKPESPSQAQAVVAAPGAKPPSDKPVMPPTKTFHLFIDPTLPAVYELPSGALATWRQHSGQKPALVLFSRHPLLTPLSDAEAGAIASFVRSAPPAELVRRSRIQTADPVMMPPQAVSAAIAAGLISELIFVEPTQKEITDVSLANFQQRAFDAGFLNGEEARALTLKNGVISGTVRGIPFRCVHPKALPQLAVPVLVHIDLGYFENLYKNAVKTPPYPLIYQLVSAIRDASWPTLSLSLSYSNQEVEFPLGLRFMIATVADVAEHPQLLHAGVPPSWDLRANALYAAEMFAEGTAQELLAQAAATNPDDPAALYDYSLVLFRQKVNQQAFEALDQAVALDPGYALAYLELVDAGYDIGQVGKSRELLTKAAAALPDNPFIRMSLADLLIRSGRGRDAQLLLRELQKLPWSTTYHPQVPDLLRDLSVSAAK